MSNSETDPAMDQKSENRDVQLETFLQQSGGCGRYQVMLAITIHSMKCVVNFSMYFFVFGGAVPDWWCVDDIDGTNTTLTVDMPQYKSCYVTNSTMTCRTFRFEDSMNTIVTEFALVCDKKWISFLLPSIQMAGILLGNTICGQLADVFGRKPPLCVSYVVLIASHVAAAFVTSWTMGAVFWFINGMACGFFITVQYSIMTEYALIRWRTWLVALPSWEIETSLFALVAWLSKDWRHIHIVTAVVGAPLLLAYCYIGMESFRWYASHDRIEDARNVIKRVANINKSSAPNVTFLESNSENSKDREYTLWDLRSNRTLLTYTLGFLFIWVNLGLCTYGLQFGVSSLSGNLYINIFAIGLVGAPLRFFSIFLQNRFGRKKAVTVFNVVSMISALAVAIEYRFEESTLRNRVTNISALVSLIAIHQSWSPIQTLTIEIYPTVVRNIAYGFHNTAARVGAVIGPQLLFLDNKFPGAVYWICAVTTLISALLVLRFPETKGRDLPDKMSTAKHQNVDRKSHDMHRRENVEMKPLATY